MSNPEYEKKLRDPRWQKKRLEVFEAADWKCADCGDTKEELHAHHTGYDGREPWDYPLVNLLCLCDTCHTIRHLKPEKVKAHAERLCVNYKTIYLFSTKIRMISKDNDEFWMDEKGKRELGALQCQVLREVREFQKSIKERKDTILNRIVDRLKASDEMRKAVG